MINLWVGYDPNEAAGYHTFCHSVLTRASEPVAIHPIARNTFAWWKRQGEDNGATEFSFARFMIPYLQGYRGHAIFMDGADMLCLADIAELWAMRDPRYAVQCVQHDPYVVHPSKMWNQRNEWYPRKNWSSVMLMNCDYHHAHKLTPESVSQATGAYLHRFAWTSEERIGAIQPEWNVLVGHQPIEGAKVLHFTNGLSPIHPSDPVADALWNKERAAMNHVTPLETK